jgi:hypothetical protein
MYTITLCIIYHWPEMRGAGHVGMGEGRGADSILMGRPEGRRPLGRLSVDERIILKWIFKNWDGRAWTGLIWLRTGTGGGLL